MIQKTLSAPVFDVTRYPEEEKDLNLIFDEITYKLAQYYFSVYQAIFAKDNDTVRPSISEFLKIQDPLMRSRKLIFYFDELHQLIDKKLFYMQKT
jgi:hypothetical protein